jgi:ribonuclease HI
VVSMRELILRFDGSYKGRCGGAGAVLLSPDSDRVFWEGARFLPRCASSAAAEYEGLILGLEAAAAQHTPSAVLDVQGDCRVVLSQADGSSRSRKLSKLHTRAEKVLHRLAAKTHFTSIPRTLNAHADGLSRAAIDATRMLHYTAIMSTAHGGQRGSALRYLDAAVGDGVPLPEVLYEELLECCYKSHDWHAVLGTYRSAHSVGHSERTMEMAALALEALGAAPGQKCPASRELAGLRRQQAALRRTNASRLRKGLQPVNPSFSAAASIAKPTTRDLLERLLPKGEPKGRTRGTDAHRWHTMMFQEAMQYEVEDDADHESQSVASLLSLADRLASAGIGHEVDSSV